MNQNIEDKAVEFIKDYNMYPLKSFRKYVKFNLKLAHRTVFERVVGVASVSGLAIPPPRLRYRVHGAIGQQGFLDVGRACATDITKLVNRHGREFNSLERVLDFGCGCGRTLRFFKDHLSTQRLYGTDIDASAITWCKRYLPNLAEWSVNEMQPPTRYVDDTFDLIYAISVFTHIDETAQFAWLGELRRIAKPGGILILTVHGDFYQRRLTEAEKAVLAEKGLLFCVGQTGRWKFDGLPDSYQTTYHTKKYVEREWSRYFKVLEHVEQGMAGGQDAIMLVKTSH